VRDAGGGLVIGSEIEPSKHARAVAHLAEAGLSEVSEVRLGDARETLRELPEPIDLVLLDGWKDLYVPVLDLVLPRLRPGAVVLADNIFTFRKALRPYVESMQSGERGFASTTLHVSDGFEYSVYLGKG
jgi:predicted O-methyltransferase YrrM